MKSKLKKFKRIKDIVKREESQWLIKWKRPCDDSWLYHVPDGKFKSKNDLLKHLQDHSETPGVEFKILNRL